MLSRIAMYPREHNHFSPLHLYGKSLGTGHCKYQSNQHKILCKCSRNQRFEQPCSIVEHHQVQ